MSFRKDFIWGAATASYQIEGASFEDGKGRNVWDDFSHEPGKIFHGHTGDVACDHYHLFKKDVALMKQMGVRNYRFSLSWARILPEGTSAVCQKGVDFYNALIDELVANGIRPFVTLFHWDYPSALQARLWRPGKYGSKRRKPVKRIQRRLPDAGQPPVCRILPIHFRMRNSFAHSFHHPSDGPPPSRGRLKQSY